MNKESRPRYRVLVNCSNLHVGGAVAVAASFIDCLSRRKDENLDFYLLLSSSVSRSVRSLNSDVSGFKETVVKDFYGVRSTWQGLDSHFKGMDLVFSVFGPAYFILKRTQHVFGFAQPLIIYPSNPISRKLSCLGRLKQRLKYKIQELFFSRADELIVELEHVKRGLQRKRFFKDKKIHIVYSAVDSVFKMPERWELVAIGESTCDVKLGLVSRNYPHKNLLCLPELKKLLLSKYGFRCQFYVTFPDVEWTACSDSFRAEINNVGPLTLAQCPSFYSRMDGVVFPSLLECFSAVPIETMMMKKPLFASDLPFIKDCSHEHANYFDPLDLESMARAIHDYYSLPVAVRETKLNEAYEYVMSNPGAEERAASYVRIINNALDRCAC